MSRPHRRMALGPARVLAAGCALALLHSPPWAAEAIASVTPDAVKPAPVTPAPPATVSAPASAPREFEIETVASQGSGPSGFQLLVRVSRASLTVADLLIVEVVWTSPSVSPPAWPSALQKIEGFTTISTTDRGPDATADGRFEFRRRLTLEPFLPGERQIPALEFALSSTAPSNDASRGSLSASEPPRTSTQPAALTSAPIPIKVEALVTEPPENPEGLIKALAGSSPLGTIPQKPTSFWQSPGMLALVGGGVLIGMPLLIAAASLALRRRPTAEQSPLDRLRELSNQIESARAMSVPQAALDEIASLLRSVLAERAGPSALAATMPELPHFARTLTGPESATIAQHVSEIARSMDNARFASDDDQRRAAALTINTPLRLLLNAWDRDAERSKEARA